jgi:hypothetical protein
MLSSPDVAVRPPTVQLPGDLDGAGRWRGGPASAGAASARLTGSEPVAGVAALAAGGCCARLLPADPTSAGMAREVFRDAATLLSLPRDLTSDGVTMVSELAANTLHALGNVEFDQGGAVPLAGGPELWIYLRRVAGRWELVCMVFDSLSGWKGARAPAPGDAEPDSVSGRGLQIVAGLSAGRWGHHLTRSRFGGWKVPGKVVWFGQAVPGICIPGPLRRCRLAPGRAARALEGMLVERGLGGGLLRVQEPSAEMAVLSVRCGLTVWCRDKMIFWRTPDGRLEKRVPTDLEDIAEQLICTCAEMDRGADLWHRGLDRVR